MFLPSAIFPALLFLSSAAITLSTGNPTSNTPRRLRRNVAANEQLNRSVKGQQSRYRKYDQDHDIADEEKNVLRGKTKGNAYSRGQGKNGKSHAYGHRKRNDDGLSLPLSIDSGGLLSRGHASSSSASRDVHRRLQLEERHLRGRGNAYGQHHKKGKVRAYSHGKGIDDDFSSSLSRDSDNYQSEESVSISSTSQSNDSRRRLEERRLRGKGNTYMNIHGEIRLLPPISSSSSSSSKNSVSLDSVSNEFVSSSSNTSSSTDIRVRGKLRRGRGKGESSGRGNGMGRGNHYISNDDLSYRFLPKSSKSSDSEDSLTKESVSSRNSGDAHQRPKLSSDSEDSSSIDSVSSSVSINDSSPSSSDSSSSSEELAKSPTSYPSPDWVSALKSSEKSVDSNHNNEQESVSPPMFLVNSESHPRAEDELIRHLRKLVGSVSNISISESTAHKESLSSSESPLHRRHRILHI